MSEESKILPFEKARSRRGKFSPITNEELSKRPFPEIQWIWEPFIPVESLVVMGAFMKVGKSTLVYDLIVSISQNRPVLGFPTKQVPILILAVEEAEGGIRRRLKHFGSDPTDNIHWHIGTLENSPETFDSIGEYVKAHNIGLIVLDTIGRFWKLTDENDNAQVQSQVNPWLNFAHEYGISVLLVHHENKGGGEDGRSLRGASSLFGSVDQALIITKVTGANENRRMLKVLGRYDESPQKTLYEYHKATGIHVGLGENKSSLDQLQSLIGAISETPKTIGEIAEEADVSLYRAKLLLIPPFPPGVQQIGTGLRGSPYQYKLDKPF